MPGRTVRNSIPGTPPIPPMEHRFRAFAGTIVRGMNVLSDQDVVIGQVERVEGDHIVLVPTGDSDRDAFFVPLSLVAGVHDNQVLLAGRGDSIFGLVAQP